MKRRKERRALGTGSIYFSTRKNRWQATIRATSGRLLQFEFHTEREAEDKLRQLLDEGHGYVIDPRMKAVRGKRTKYQPPEKRDIPLGLRFQILERDGFACQYCGAEAPDARLSIDHVKALVDGGTSGPRNLITACLDCNVGKGPHSLQKHREMPAPDDGPVDIGLEIDLRVKPGGKNLEYATRELQRESSEGYLALGPEAAARILQRDILDVLVCWKVGTHSDEASWEGIPLPSRGTTRMAGPENS